MTTQPFTIERTYNAPIANVWEAITDKAAMKQWYFDLAEFKPEVGFKFEFKGGPPEKQYLHLCEVTEVIEGKKITYSWRYDGYAGISYVTFELFEQGASTKLQLTHTGLESFPHDNIDFAPFRFAQGWTAIIGTSLTNYLEPGESRDYRHTIVVKAAPATSLDSLTNKVNEWWSQAFEGSAANIGDEFTVRFGNTYKTIRVESIVPRHIIWKCIGAHIDSKQLDNKSEWIGTRMVWNIIAEGDGTSITLTHIGLNRDMECYNVCEKGWGYFLDESLKPYLDSGVGKPDKR